MDDFLGFVVLVIYLIAAFSGKKKKAKKKQKKQRDAFERAFDSGMLEELRQMKAEPSQAATVFPEGAMPMEPERTAACETRPIHLHVVTQQELHDAQEGEDPCHAGGAEELPDEVETFSLEEEADDELRKEVLRGVIMSEILTRPRDRMALRGNRRSAT